MSGGSSENPVLAQAVIGSIWNVLSNVHTALPGEITSYDATTQKAEVKPLLKKNFLDGTELSLPVISSVPVVFPRTAKASLTFPMEAGDKVLLIFSERSLDEYLSLGREVKPQDRRKFDLSDAVAIPGLYDFSTPSPSNGEDVELKYDTQKITIKANGDIEIGADTLKKLVNEEFKDLFNNHVHSGIGLTGTIAVVGAAGTCVITAGNSVATTTKLGDSHMSTKAKAQ